MRCAKARTLSRMWTRSSSRRREPRRRLFECQKGPSELTASANLPPFFTEQTKKDPKSLKNLNWHDSGCGYENGDSHLVSSRVIPAYPAKTRLASVFA